MERLKNAIERVVFLPMRIRHRKSAHAKHKARAAALANVRSVLERVTQLNSKSVRIVFNVGMYVLMLDQDLADFADYLVHATGDRRRAFIAKHEATLLYEAAEDLPQLLGRDFRSGVQLLGASQKQLARLNSVASELSKFRHDHREFLGTIRNALAAHRDHDALCYAQNLELLKPLEVMARAAELSDLLNRLVGLLTEFAYLTANPILVLQDIVASRKPGSTS